MRTTFLTEEESAKAPEAGMCVACVRNRERPVWQEQGRQLGEFQRMSTDAPKMQDLFLVLSPSPHPQAHSALPWGLELPLKQLVGSASLLHSLGGSPASTLSDSQAHLHSECHTRVQQPDQAAPTGPHQVLQMLAFSGFPRPAAWPRPRLGLCPEKGHSQLFFPS